MTNEEFYDAKIAPVLHDLGKQCQERGMGFVAIVDYTGEGNLGRTTVLPCGAPAILRYADALGQADAGGGALNLDSFMIAVMREARLTGHSSVILEKLGVSAVPTTEV